MELGLRGKTVLITGASKGIGAATAEVFAEEGCHLRLAARDEALLLTLAERLTREHGVKAYVHVADLRQSDQVAGLAAAADDIDILINNAGDIPGGPLDMIDEATWRQAWDLKVFGYINLTRAYFTQMKAKGRGVIVNIIGSAGERMDAHYIAGSDDENGTGKDQ